jgi:hypothetical protein
MAAFVHDSAFICASSLFQEAFMTLCALFAVVPRDFSTRPLFARHKGFVGVSYHDAIQWFLILRTYDISIQWKFISLFHFGVKARPHPPNANEIPVNTMSGPYVVPYPKLPIEIVLPALTKGTLTRPPLT